VTNNSGNEKYKQSGPYLGVNMNWAIPDAGKIAFSVAYAVLNADNVYVDDGDGVGVGETREFDDISGKNNGDTTGYSFSLGWTMPIKGSLLFRSRLKVNQYKQDIRYDGVNYNNISESSTMLLVGVTNIF